jgi:molybdopterin-containing oxidoreductase family iron-sulfur binding subunit
MSEKQYWKGLEELHNSAAHQEVVANEFKDSNLPLADLSDSLLGATTPRRDFLKYLGFSTAAAVVAASCEMPVRKAITYGIRPENVVPGVPEYYASTYVDGGEAVPVIVKTRDGRPIKIEGNDRSSLTMGSTTARMQASVLSLYDVARLRGPRINDKETTFDALDRSVMAGLGNGPVVLVTTTISSPTLLEAISRFTAKTGARHIQWDPVSYSALMLANEASYGRRAIPFYHFDRAETIVSLGADFLGTWLNPATQARQYAEGRKISARNLRMSRHYQVESLHTISGAAADRRATCRPSQMGAVAVALYNAVASGTTPNLPSPALNKLVTQAAADLKKGRGLVVCSSDDVNVQTVVNAINSAIGANGTTIDWGTTNNTKKGSDADMAALLTQMKAGQVGTVIFSGVNPVYEWPNSKEFKEALAKVPTRISTADRMDETAQACTMVVPDHHWLESWGDAEPRSGYYSLMQPTIAPLFKTRALADSLLIWAGNGAKAVAVTGTVTQGDSTKAVPVAATTGGATYADLWKNYWMGRLGSQEAFDLALQDGVIEPGGARKTATNRATGSGNEVLKTDTASGVGMMAAAGSQTEPAEVPQAPASPGLTGAAYSGNTGAAVTAIGAMPVSKNPEVIVYEKISIGHGGAWSNNPWLLEMPDPITKATWDNYATLSPQRAKDLDAELTGINEVDPAKRVVSIKYNGLELRLPVVVVPGQHNDVVGIALGFGRDKQVGRAAADTGRNAYPMRVWNGRTLDCANTKATIETTGDTYEVAITQTHHSYEARPIIQEFTLGEFSKDPMFLMKKREEELGHFAHNSWEDHGGGHEGAAHEGAAAHAGAAEGHGGTGHEGAGATGAEAHSVMGVSGAVMAAADTNDFNAAWGGPEAAEQGGGALEKGFRENGTLYPNYVSPGVHWGMSIDLSSCIGCGACVMGCQAENNISVVGKEHVKLAHEMHWIRIDRYFSGSPENPDSIQTVFQPMMCQHCDNAPCENVCPVAATPHSSEGLNMMTYNRCIGTKYCANNCPYKVRHFNWMDWNEADCFEDNTYEDYKRDDMNDNLTRMVLNPDVTVRSRGVMEKCSFCVQRLQEGKLAAKKDGRPLRDGEVKTACQQACPTDAIVFGNVNDPKSAIYQLRKNQQKERMYYVLEEIHTLPNVNYLSKIRNTDVKIAGTAEDGLYQRHI